MSEKKLGIIGGGQLGSLLCVAAKKLNIKTIVYNTIKDFILFKIYLIYLSNEILIKIY